MMMCASQLIIRFSIVRTIIDCVSNTGGGGRTARLGGRELTLLCGFNIAE